MKQRICCLLIMLLCTSSALAAGPRGYRGWSGGQRWRGGHGWRGDRGWRGNRHRQSQFPVIVDYQSSAGWNSGTTVLMPSGSASYTSYAPGWGTSVHVATPAMPPAVVIPSAAAPGALLPAPHYAPQHAFPGPNPHYGWSPESVQQGHVFPQNPSSAQPNQTDQPQLEGSESSAGDAGGLSADAVSDEF